MSKIKLPHASGNSMSISAPSTNPSGDLELKLPATIGTANQVIANGSTPGTLEFVENDSRTLLSTTTLSGTSTVVSVDLTGYLHLEGALYGATVSSGNVNDTYIRMNSLSTNIYKYVLQRMDNNGTTSEVGDQGKNAFYYNMTGVAGWTTAVNWANFTFSFVNLGIRKPFKMNAGGELSTGPIVLNTTGYVDSTASITSIQIGSTSTLTGGTLKLYGVK